jgi:radical SAM superfamily enzyme YgiQ (UPF0313 family)
MIKVALVNPNVEPSSSTAPPFNLLNLASYVQDIADVMIIDEVAGHDVESELSKFRPHWVGITVQTPCAYRAYHIANYAKRALDCKVVLGGHHTSAMQDEAIQFADHIVVGEGERAFKRLITGEVSSPVVIGEPLEDLDEVPPILWGLIDFEFYVLTKENQVDAPFLVDDPRAMTMLTTMGCPFKCIFCQYSQSSAPTRFNSAERVCLEIDRLMDVYGINCVNFNDDEFLLNRERLEKLCRHFKEVGLVWGCQARATSITEEVAELISDGGCVYVGIGIESGNQRVLGILKAGSATVEANIRAIQILKKHGIAVIGGFIYGTPSETYPEMMDTTDFIIEQPIDSIYVNSLTAFPATTLWDMVEDKVKDIDYSHLIPSATPHNDAILSDLNKDFFKKYLRFVVQTGMFKRGLSLAKLYNRSRLRLFLTKPFYLYFLVTHTWTALRLIWRSLKS